MKAEFWYCLIGLFIVPFLIGFVSFFLSIIAELILLVFTGLYYWEDYAEKERRLEYLEAQEWARRKREKEG